MSLNAYETAIVRNADFFLSRQDESGFIDMPADEFYGVRGDASLVGHSMSVRVYAWVLTDDERYVEGARRSARLLASRQDPRGGWHHDAGYALDAAQCVMEGFHTYERLTGDRQFHETLVRAADRMIEGTIAEDGAPLIGNLVECGEYAHLAFMAWKVTGLERHLEAGHAILKNITDHFDEAEGYWDTAVEPKMGAIATAVKPWLNPVLRAAVAHSDLKGKTVAKISERMLPLVMKGHGPQYSLGIMAAESLLDTLDGRIELPLLRAQTARALEWVAERCKGPVRGSFVESKVVPPGDEVYPLAAINDTEAASLWPTAATLIAYAAMNDRETYAERARAIADFIVSMQDDDGGFFTHQAKTGERFGQKYGNINFYGSMGLWYENAIYVRGEEPRRGGS